MSLKRPAAGIESRKRDSICKPTETPSEDEPKEKSEVSAAGRCRAFNESKPKGAT